MRREVVPVHQHGGAAGQQRVDEAARLFRWLLPRFRPAATEHGAAGAQHVHRVGGGGDGLQHCPHGHWQGAGRPQGVMIGRQFSRVWQVSVDQEKCHLFKLG